MTQSQSSSKDDLLGSLNITHSKERPRKEAVTLGAQVHPHGPAGQHERVRGGDLRRVLFGTGGGGPEPGKDR